MPRRPVQQILFLHSKSPDDVKRLLSTFSKKYIVDWQTWLTTCENNLNIPTEFGRILRRWQATRGKTKGRTMRRCASENKHEPPHLDDLIASAQPHLKTLGPLTVRDIPNATPDQLQALMELWNIMIKLTNTNDATCVGISKAIMLLTQGKIGPAFDRFAKNNLKIRKAPTTAAQWIESLNIIAQDITQFESTHDLNLESLTQYPSPFPLAVGRIYDMLIGPRET